MIEGTLEAAGTEPVQSFEDLYEADAEARRLAAGLVEQLAVERVSYFLAFAGFAALIILHEFGHFITAKKTGMRVERFALFFPPLLVQGPERRDRVRDRRDPARRAS